MNPKMKMKITNRQYNLLRTYSLIDTNHLANEDTNSVRLIGDEAFFRVLLDGLSDVLVQKGLISGSDEPNDIGLEIEAIIDIVSRELYS